MSKTVLFDALGGPEVFRFADVSLGDPDAGEARIRIDAIGLNRAEAFFRTGRYYYQPTLPASRIGCEASGVVEAIGSGVDHLKVGDRVGVFPGPGFFMSRHGVYGEEAIVPARSVLRTPDGIDATTAAAVWACYLTAYGALVQVAGVGPGSQVLIPAGSSGVGIAAIQIVNHLGGVPIATTRTPAKVRSLQEAGAAHVIVTTEEDLITGVKEATGGRNADVVFDPIGGPGLTDMAKTVAPGGLLIVYSWLDPWPAPLPLSWPLNIHCFAHTVVTGQPETLRQAEAFINDGLHTGALAPIVDRTFELPDIVAAHQYLESNQQVGKIVVTVPN